MKITAKAEGAGYTSARIKTQGLFEFTYGRVDVRAKLPVGGGTWPAIWMLGANFPTAGWPDCGEIDIMEAIGNDPGYVQSAIHTPSSFGATVNVESTTVTDASDAFHVYSVNWSPNQISFLVDDEIFYTYSPETKDTDTWPFDLVITSYSIHYTKLYEADLKLFNNKLDVNADYFIKKTNNLLIGNIPVSGILGIGAPGAAGPTVNAGTVRNSGFEFAVGYRGNITRELSFSVNYNLTTLKNEVLEVSNGTGFVEGGTFGVGQPAPARMEVGKPIGYFYGYKTDGLFQNQAEVDAHPSQVALGAEASPGDIRIVNINGDDVIDTDDRTDIGSPIPDATMGLNIALNYKGFDFVAYAFASLGNDIARNYERVIPDVNKLSYKLDRWRGEGTSNSVPRVTTAATSNTVFSDFYVEDGSFLRLQNIQLGYTFPAKIVDRLPIRSLRLYTSISNLFTLTNYMGYDPAASSGEPIGSGFDNGFYPAARTYTFGLNLNF